MTRNVFTVCTSLYVWASLLHPRKTSTGRVYQGHAILVNRGSYHYALEAWERMTQGGLKVPCLPGFPYAHTVETPTLTCAFIADFGPPEWT